MLNFESAIPLYQQVADDIKEKIQTGEYASGQMLPSEAKFCEMYQVSRVTLRNAIADLADQGLVIKKHGKGTFVEQKKISSDLHIFSGLTTICRENHIESRTHILSAVRQPASMYDIRMLDLSKDDDVVYIKRLRFANEQPVIIEHVYLPYKEYSFLLDLVMENRSLYATIQHHTGLNPEKDGYSDVILEVSSATEEEASLLNIPPEKPVFIMKESVRTRAGIPIHRTKQVMSGNYFKFDLSCTQNMLSLTL